MKINSVNSGSNISNHSENRKNSKKLNFKGIENFPGAVMQGMEKGGFLLSFLVQDTLGMTCPRTYEGLKRNVSDDKKGSFKNLNFKEGAEVFIREFLSGPLMMFTPVAVLLLGKKALGKSSFTNSGMLKTLGKTFKETAANAAGKSNKELKADFYRRNITNIVQNTTKAADKPAETAFIETVVGDMEKLDRYSEKISAAKGKMKCTYKAAQKRSKQELVKKFNDFHKTHSSDFTLMNKVKPDKDSVFATDKMIDGMRSYASDALKDKNASELSEEYADKFLNKSIISRHVVNGLAALSTIASTSIVPLIYKIVNPVPPGSVDSCKNAVSPSQQAENSKEKTGNQVSFTGKAETFAKHFEFNGTQLTPALMTSLAVGGLIVPRVGIAVKRAPENPVTKKKDYSEVPEILTRDVISTSAVAFGVPMLSKAIVSSYEDKSGFVLQNRPDKPMSKFKKILDKLNPFSGYSPYSLSSLNEIYDNINTESKLKNFNKFIDENNGSLAKVFGAAEGSEAVFNEYGLNIKELSSQSDRKAANRIIIDKTANTEFAEKLMALMKPAKSGKANDVLKRARSLNSITTFASTFFLVPGFLGIILPKAVYGLTARHQKKLAEQINELRNQNQNQQTNNQQNTDDSKKIDYSKLKYVNNNTAFTRLKHC